jgi:hypothetical protein
MRFDRALLGTIAAFAIALTVVRGGSPTDWKGFLKSRLGPRRTTILRCLARGKRLPRWGNLRVEEPFSSNWGIDRGTPVDRYFADAFFEENGGIITGKVLEIQDTVHAKRFGVNVRHADSIDIDEKFQPTFVCDLARAEAVVPSNSYDCFLAPYTFPFIKDLEDALRNTMRIIKPGGSILATMSVLTPVFSECPEYWRMTEDGWRALLHRVWAGHEVEVRTHGNCLTAMSSVLGLAQEELKTRELDRHDPRVPVVISVKARKVFA